MPYFILTQEVIVGEYKTKKEAKEAEERELRHNPEGNYQIKKVN